MIEDMVWASVWIAGMVCVTVYSIAQLRVCANPVSELQKAGELLEKGMITEEEFRGIKKKMMRRIR